MTPEKMCSYSIERRKEGKKERKKERKRDGSPSITLDPKAPRLFAIASPSALEGWLSVVKAKDIQVHGVRESGRIRCRHSTCRQVEVLKRISPLEGVDRHLLTNATFRPCWKNALERRLVQSGMENRGSKCEGIARKQGGR